MTQFVGIIQQGVVLDQRAVAVDSDRDVALRAAEVEAERISAAQTGEAEGYSAVVVELPEATG